MVMRSACMAVSYPGCIGLMHLPVWPSVTAHDVHDM